MQPYFLPHLTYLQLIHAADNFIVLDNVNYIKKGWINRNRILLNNQPHLFTVPIKQASQNKMINELELAEPAYVFDKFSTLIYHAYHQAPFFKETIFLLNKIFNKKYFYLLEIIFHSLKLFNQILELNTCLEFASNININTQAKGADRIIKLCQAVDTSIYVNTEGGRQLYKANEFSKYNITLKFIHNNVFRYPQHQLKFIDHLSIIDVLMFNGIEKTKQLVKQYQLLSA
ncbi:MAG: WbqC family protein [Gammaproteobacteria bacterium]